MTTLSAHPPPSPEPGIDPHEVESRFGELLRNLHARTDRFFARFLLAEWAVCVGAACASVPHIWTGSATLIDPRVWIAALAGGAVVLVPAWLGLKRPGRPATRHLLAAAQVLVSSLLVYLAMGRFGTPFHLFGALAFLAAYREAPLLFTATGVVFFDRLARGLFWPGSVYGVMAGSRWGSVAYLFWVLFEVVFLWALIRRSRGDMRHGIRRQLVLEQVNGEMEQVIRDRTAEMLASERRYRTLFQEAPIGLYRAAPDGRMYLANPAMLQMLGFASAKELRDAFLPVQGTEQEEDRRQAFVELIGAGAVYGRDLSWRRKDGSLLMTRESIRATRDGEGKVLYFDGSVEDVTERRKLEERYLQAQKVQAIGQLAGGIAHDFNNMLTAILGYSDLLLEAGSLEAYARSHVLEIKRAGERASGLTQQLLAFSRKQTLQPRILSLNGVVGEMDKMLRRLVGEHIDIQTRLAPDLARTKADPGQIQQVLMNLAVNARDAMPEGGKLTIETSNGTLDAEYCRLHPETVPGAYVVIAVSDNGVGMTQQVKARLFEPFFTTKEAGRGTGLGLATCHGIVKQSGGHIAVYSEVGYGTTFRIYLPCTAEADGPAEAAPAPRAVGGTETVLFVEDEPMVRQLGVIALSSLGYRVIEAAHGVLALEYLERLAASGGSIQLLVTDVVMPEMGGRELARRARALFPEIRLLFTSGYTHDALGRTEPMEGGTFFLSKPYTMTSLAGMAREAFREPPPAVPVPPVEVAAVPASG